MGESKLDLTQRFRLAQRHIVLFFKELPCLRRFEYRLAYSMLDFHLVLSIYLFCICITGDKNTCEFQTGEILDYSNRRRMFLFIFYFLLFPLFFGYSSLVFLMYSLFRRIIFSDLFFTFCFCFLFSIFLPFFDHLCISVIYTHNLFFNTREHCFSLYDHYVICT
jgi:predicted nucleic acid-binding Zn ribbon protein